MSNFLFDLATNLTILAVLLVACHLGNLAKPELALNGGFVFVVMVAIALVFDAALTFLVFADAPTRYGKFGSPAEFVHRACAWAIVSILAMFIAFRASRSTRRSEKKAGDAIVIHTSPYTESHLHL
ncbi:hypothetical protein [Paraburkholderia sp. DHOC27]|uniref:hypothetical protein n=1 Tax=Paraburkholderia sp. DHOC27 TaxID=2303330 RepID=UPI000E3CCA98|nr:hypothetical protein [Paraburkholderia sp. DHOC27]RFU45898.1 hypothetical protein D0B32_19715 [Paraburkholderia sp. DHOC27]